MKKIELSEHGKMPQRLSQSVCFAGIERENATHVIGKSSSKTLIAIIPK